MGTADVSAPVSVRSEDVAGVLDRVRRRTPLVQCLTNSVVTGFTANALLAAGASPAMVEEPEEASELARAADAVLVNVGTPTEATSDAMRAAAHAAHAVGTPWVLDPVAVGPLTFRTRLAAELIGKAPTVVRGNPSEVLSLAGATGNARGVDSATDAASALPAAVELARRESLTIAVSGPTDYITDGQTTVELRTGHSMMTSVTGVGCVLGALVAACCAVEQSPLLADGSATALLTVAAEVAAEQARGPGSFQVGLLDALYTLDAATLQAYLDARQEADEIGRSR